MAKQEVEVVEVVEQVLLETNGKYEEVGIDTIDVTKADLVGTVGDQRVYRNK